MTDPSEKGVWRVAAEVQWGFLAVLGMCGISLFIGLLAESESHLAPRGVTLPAGAVLIAATLLLSWRRPWVRVGALIGTAAALLLAGICYGEFW